MSHYPPVSDRLKADGNLTYLGFIALLEELWSEAYPGIPFYASGTSKENLTYPCVLYKLQLREPFSGEKKPRVREILSLEDTELVITGWRFRNFIQFIALDDESPKRADDVIEVFEDFMLEHTPVFKQLGLSDIFYGRREPDDDVTNIGDSVAERTLTYIVITEKTITLSHERLEKIEIYARQKLEALESEVIHSRATKSHAIHGIDTYLA